MDQGFFCEVLRASTIRRMMLWPRGLYDWKEPAPKERVGKAPELPFCSLPLQSAGRPGPATGYKQGCTDLRWAALNWLGHQHWINACACGSDHGGSCGHVHAAFSP
jgi:hypothetical protein